MHQGKAKFTEGLIDSRLVIKILDIKPGQTVVDAGCGTGYMSRLFSASVEKTGKVYAVDNDICFINSLKNKVGKTNIKPIKGDITMPTGIAGSSVDIVYASTLIHAFRENKMRGFISEVLRLLKIGGCLSIVEMNKEDTPFGPPLEFRYSSDELTGIIPMIPVETVKLGEYFYLQLFRKK